MKLSRIFNSLPKRIASGALLALAVALPVATSAASTVNFSATTGVANVTAGDTTYKSSVNATYNQVVKVEVTYDNKEAPSSNKSVSNLTVKINVPTTPGQSQHITSKVSGSNINTVNGSVAVNLDRSDAYLQYIPGTAEWKHADAQTGKVVEQKISDNIVTGATGLNLGSGAPCQAGSVAVSVGVYIPGVSINKQVREKGTKTWATSITANPGDTVQYLISYKNTGNTTEKNVVIGDKLPAGMTYVPGSTVLANDSAPNGKYVGDGVVTTGIIIGTYDSGVNAFVMFDAKVPTADKLACGTNTLRNIASAQPEGMNYYYNTADVVVNKTCTPAPKQPTYTCDLFHVTTGDNRTVTVDKFKTSVTNGAVFKNVVIDWGDQSNALSTNKAVGQKYSYKKDGTYTITATAHFTANDKDVTAPTANCTQTVSFTTPTTPTTPQKPTQLVNTGAGDMVGLFGAVVIASAFAHRLFLSRRLSREG